MKLDRTLSFDLPLLSAIFGEMKVRSIGAPRSYLNEKTGITTITTTVKVLVEDDESTEVTDKDTTQILDILLKGAHEGFNLKKNTVVDFVNSTITVKSDGRLTNFNKVYGVSHWLDTTIRAERLVLSNPETGEVTEVGIESVKPSGENKPQETPEQQAPTQESNKPKGNKGN